MPESVASIVFASLRAMDREATHGRASGQPCGLCDYAYFVRPELKRPQNEVEWSKRITADLIGAGLNSSDQLYYPSYAILPGFKRQRCDVVVPVRGGGRLWLELKGSWRNYWGGTSKIYRSYLLHPLVANLDESKKHTVPLDLRRLARLRHPDATHVAELLVSFESMADPVADEIDTLRRLAGLHEWSEHLDSWESPTVPDQRVRCWFWWREVTVNSSPVPASSRDSGGSNR